MKEQGSVPERAWWKEAVVYQIYPRSFKDSNGDGIGDLPGILEKLDHLSWLGIDVVWLCPVYDSPNDDNGYDIRDYRAILQEYGTMDDFRRLLNELHARGIRLVMDLVVNHTSDEHPWFREAQSGRDSPYRDYYIWSLQPNNWASFFGGSAWQWHEQTGMYYLHLFSVKQPDLNWENPRVRREVHEIMRFWLDQGVDGFRMDVINAISKVPGFPDAPPVVPGELRWGGAYFLNGPRVHEYLQEMYRDVLSHYDVMTVGETLSVTPEQALEYVGEDRNELNMVLQFELMDLDAGPGGKWDVRKWRLSELKRIVSRWQTALAGRGWNALYLSNHDQPRAVSRFGNDGPYRVQSAKMLGTLLLTLQGTPFIYQGEELGMTNAPVERIEDCRDIETLNWYREQREQGQPEEELLAVIRRKGRDNARTPMQWSNSLHAGFTTGTPWIPVNPNYACIHAEGQYRDPDSVAAHYRRLIQLRKRHPVLVYGDFTLLDPDDESVFSFTRRLGEAEAVVILNFTDASRTWMSFADLTAGASPGSPIDRSSGQQFVASAGSEAVQAESSPSSGWSLAISNYPDTPEALPNTYTLRPYEACVFFRGEVAGSC
ncbi:MAG: alpha-glucosidase [Alicyclobacillus sp.]|nr:alpha-glucosidase [Alicyclobacillus sp.]